MKLEIVTGYTGEAHVYSSDERAFNRNVMGNENYVLKNGGQFECELIDNKTLRIYEGDLIMQGVHARIRTGEYVDISIGNGSQGMYRNILVCAYYYMNTSSEENVILTCEYGDEVNENPVDPICESGDLSKNERGAYFPLYRLTQNASNITNIEKIYNKQKYTIDDMSKLVSQIFLLAHPVGSIYMSTSPINPSMYYGGKWAVWGSGRVPTGVNPSDSNFNAVEKRGGETKIGLSVGNLPPHSHGLNGHTHGKGSLSVTVGNHSHSGLYHGNSEVTYFSDLFSSGSLAGIRGVSSGTRVRTGSTQPSASVSGETAAANGSTSNTGSGAAFSILQPYITCYMWKRIA